MKSKITSVVGLLSLLLVTGSSFAQPRHHDSRPERNDGEYREERRNERDRDDDRGRGYERDRDRDGNRNRDRDWERDRDRRYPATARHYDPRPYPGYGHPRPYDRYPRHDYYRPIPRHRVMVVNRYQPRYYASMPYGCRPVTYGRHHYYYGNGYYYRPWGSGFRIVMPPIGIHINFLPANCRRIVWGPRTYFYFQGVFYSQLPMGRGYEVVAPPYGVIVYDLPGESRRVRYDGRFYEEYNNVLYNRIQTPDGPAYEVAEVLEQELNDGYVEGW